MNIFYYPRLSTTDFGFFRIGGPGLANCMFFAANAYVNSVVNNGKFIEPTWTKFSVGPILRKERDKRVYYRLFKTLGIAGVKKLILLVLFKSLYRKKVISQGPYDLGGYFTDLNKNADLVKAYFKQITLPTTIDRVHPEQLKDKVALHVRMGDYPPDFRVPLSWYQSMISKIRKFNPNQQFILFSDGSDEELSPLMEIESVTRAFLGNAFADLNAISHCRLLLASDSTFSAWGAFLGDVPIIFQKRHFPSVYNGRVAEFILQEEEPFPSEIIRLLDI